MDKKGPDVISLLKLQDMIDIFYTLNRIKDNSYDQNLYKQLNKMNPVDRTESLMRHMSQNVDDNTKQNTEVFINILRSIDLLNQSQYKKIRNNSNMSRSLGYNESDIISKIKIFLKSLNDEE